MDGRSIPWGRLEGADTLDLVEHLGRRPLSMESSRLLPLTSDMGWLLSAMRAGRSRLHSARQGRSQTRDSSLYYCSTWKQARVPQGSPCPAGGLPEILAPGTTAQAALASS